VLEEESLVRRAQQYDQQAFAQLYEEHFDKIYRYVALRVGDKAEAEDITQQVFLKALRSIASFRWKGTPFSAWLFRIAHNQVVDYLRQKTKQATVSIDEVQVSVSSDPQLLMEQRLNIEQLIAATKCLTEMQREVISLRFAGELPIAQVAKIMGKSEGAIKALQHSAIVALRRALLAESE
jgi:RNA polymerase sigma-70 factor (ECF subfamily)